MEEDSGDECEDRLTDRSGRTDSTGLDVTGSKRIEKTDKEKKKSFEYFFRSKGEFTINFTTAAATV